MRPLKTGLDYFPHDTDAVNDDKLQALMALYGMEGYAFYFILLERIYRTENGSFPCGKLMEKVGITRVMGITIERFDEIMQASLEIGCFDNELFNSNKCITSNGIQKRLEKVNEFRLKERKRKETLKDININRKRTRKNPPKTPVLHTENSKYLDLFNILWGKYPNKDGKKEAERHFIASVKTETDLLNIKKALNNYLQHLKIENWKRPKNGSTWFNNWQDWIDIESNDHSDTESKELLEKTNKRIAAQQRLEKEIEAERDAAIKRDDMDEESTEATIF